MPHSPAAIALFAALVFYVPAAAANIADNAGRWSCTPKEPLAPQIEIDFAERTYRRCDENICSTYDLTGQAARLTASDETVEIAFAPLARLVAAPDGRWFVESLSRGGHEYRITGTCRYREAGSVPEPDGGGR